MKSIFIGKVLLIFFGTLFGLFIAEGILRIYNPLPSRVKGDEIALLTNYKREVVLKKSFEQRGLGDTINYSTNSIGFRGLDPPQQLDQFYTIFTVGGSTTECSLLDDKKTWSFLLEKELKKEMNNIWLNNAGIDGASTYGHSKLLNQEIIKYKPNMVIFLIGINDMHKAKTQAKDEFLNTSREFRLRKLARKSELFSFLWNLYRMNVSKSMKIGHYGLKYPEAISSDEYQTNFSIYSVDQISYKKRLSKLVKECIDRNIEPVLITQPIFNLSKEHPYYFVSLYNQTTAEVAKENGVFFIDLATKLEDNPDYFYDSMHFTNVGAKQVAMVIANNLIDKIKLQGGHRAFK